ncbi:hypothetical protein HDU91_006319 [Kappamyces sp. JEL0680]|nr:hypothetical protein HDU91_006319 [Kappamyces sp. JEL0680]
MVELVDDFVQSLSQTATTMCVHRQSEVLEVEDAQLIAGKGVRQHKTKAVEKNFNIKIPGFGVDGQSSHELLAARKRRGVVKSEAHSSKVAAVRDMSRKAGIIKRNARLRSKK